MLVEYCEDHMCGMGINNQAYVGLKRVIEEERCNDMSASPLFTDENC